LTKAEVASLRESVEFSLQSAYGGLAVLDTESQKPSEWVMTVPVFSASAILMSEIMKERSEYGIH